MPFVNSFAGLPEGKPKSIRTNQRLHSVLLHQDPTHNFRPSRHDVRSSGDPVRFLHQRTSSNRIPRNHPSLDLDCLSILTLAKLDGDSSRVFHCSVC